MASIYGTAYANFAPNVQGTTEVSQLASYISTSTSSSVTINEVSGPVYNVLKYGAVADGVSDSSAAIQSAINACAVTGGIVYFPKGTYSIGSTILTLTSVSNVMLEGQGRRSTVIKRTSGTANCINILSASGGGIRNLGIDGNNISSTTVRIENTSNYIIESCTITNPTANAISINATGGTKTTNCRFQNIDFTLATTANGISISNSVDNEHLRFDNLTFTGGVLQFSITNGTNLTFSRNVHLSNNTNHCIATSAGTNFVFQNCRILTGQASGVSLTGVSNATITGCHFQNVAGSGLTVSNSPKAKIVNNIFIDNNTLGSVSGGHIRLLNTSTDALIANNHFIKSAVNTINHVYIDATSTGALITGNYMPSADATPVNAVGTAITNPRTVVNNIYASRPMLSESTAGAISLYTSTNSFTLNPATITSSYTLSLPTGLPTNLNSLLVDSSGQLTFSSYLERVLVSTNQTFSTVSLTDAYLTQVMIPANSIGPNGFVTVQMLWERSNTTNNVSCGLLASSNSSASVIGTSILFNASPPYGQTITGSNLTFSTSSYIIYGNGTDSSSIIVRYTTTASGVVTHNTFSVSIDTSQNWYLKFVGSTTNAATTCYLRNYCIKTLYSP